METPRSAVSMRTWDRIGIVLRFSTIPWTRWSPFSKALREMVSSIVVSLPRGGGLARQSPPLGPLAAGWECVAWGRAGATSRASYALIALISVSTVALSWGSWRIRSLICFTAWITVEWSFPPNWRPISGNEDSVSVRHRYIASCRGDTTVLVRRFDFRSA